jgi:hypothetical protein
LTTADSDEADALRKFLGTVKGQASTGQANFLKSPMFSDLIVC